MRTMRFGSGPFWLLVRRSVALKSGLQSCQDGQCGSCKNDVAEPSCRCQPQPPFRPATFKGALLSWQAGSDLRKSGTLSGCLPVLVQRPPSGPQSTLQLCAGQLLCCRSLRWPSCHADNFWLKWRGEASRRSNKLLPAWLNQRLSLFGLALGCRCGQDCPKSLIPPKLHAWFLESQLHEVPVVGRSPRGHS